MTKTQINMELEDELIATLDKMAGKALKRQAVARMLLIAAIEAVQANGGKVHLPPKLAVTEDSDFRATSFRINEPQTTKRK
jgi:hypothetical protein